MNTQNLTLLSQEEIDTLVDFLSSKKSITGDILSQESIDKLIALIQNTDKKTVSLINAEHIEAALSPETSNELSCKLDDTTKYIMLYTMDKDRHEVPVTPAGVEHPSVLWGYAIAPNVFDHIAQTNQLQYSKETFQFICDTFAKVMYGDKDYPIPDFYLPEKK